MENNANLDSKKIVMTCLGVMSLALVVRGIGYYAKKSNAKVSKTDVTQPDYSSNVKKGLTDSEPIGTPKPVRLFVTKDAVQIPLQMIECPKGSYFFETFAPIGLPQYKKESKSVSITKPFLLSACEITQGFYQSIKGVDPSRSSKNSNAPVDSLSWFDALDFCNQLSILSNLQPCYKITNIRMQDTERDGSKAVPFIADAVVEWDSQANGFRLPTEEEWQYAAIANSNTTYIGSNSADESCWYQKNSSDQSQTVGTKKANAWGFYDMGGNVAEFCWVSTNEQNINKIKGAGVSKGGSFTSVLENLFATPSFRNVASRLSNIGFRVAKNV